MSHRSSPSAASPSTSSVTSAVAPHNANSEHSPSSRASVFRAGKITQLFSSPRSKGADTAYTAASSLLAARISPQPAALFASSSPTINPASLSLPTISLSTATSDNAILDASPTTTLFQPPSPADTKRISRQHAQFGPLGHSSHKHTSRFLEREFPDPIIDEPPYFYLLTTYLSYLILIVFGHVRDYFGKMFRKEHYRHLQAQDGYAPLNSDFDSFYVRRLKTRLNDCFARPVVGVPGRYITLLDRDSDDYNLTFRLTGTTTETLNLSSYNYLGFAQSEGPCADAAEEAVRRCGMSLASPRADAGTSDLHLEVENLIASFVGKPAAMLFSMGFVTNATVFPAIVGKGCLIISDELNHASIRFGARLSGAMIEMFEHNDVRDLERVLREAISQGQPRTHRPWKKIVVVVEGLYSMEGTMCNLPGIVELRRRYKFHLFVDEAHSIGALGPRGRGVCDYFKIDPAEVDILMGTLTKSFGANGGYIAGDAALVAKLRITSAGTLYGESPTPPVLMQIMSSLRLIMGEVVPGQGEERLQRLAFNSRYLRLGLKRLGFIVYGHDDSPIVPLLLYHPAKMPAFSHEMLRRKISVVVVGYPATPLVSSRARFCVSAAHTKDDLDRVLVACDEIGNALQLKFSSGVAGGLEDNPDQATSSSASASSRSPAATADAKMGWKRPVRSGRRGRTSERPLKPPRWRLEDVLRDGVQDVKAPLR
ncbi:MAG: serine palmitoyltransferase, long chain base subunit [Lichina confinis]|nr:MAG: serine palmitoyltransferase, long chain base subunit [Lichina confinis]